MDRKNIVRDKPLAAPEAYVSGIEDQRGYRSSWDRDRDRVVYSKAFRRLAGKTQLVLPTSHDHVRTRLTHTIQVSQIARTIAFNLGLNETLTEAIALAHDVGHAPFGHVGERTLNHYMNGCEPECKIENNSEKGYKHNLQSLRILVQEDINLSNFCLWGIANHTKSDWKSCEYYSQSDDRCLLHVRSADCLSNGQLYVRDFYGKLLDKARLSKDSDSVAWSFEGLVVAFADEIAQRHHDIEDALYLNLEKFEEILAWCKPLEERGDEEDKQRFKIASRVDDKGRIAKLASFLINILTKNVIDESSKRFIQFMEQNGIATHEQFSNKRPDIDLDRVSGLVSYSSDVEKIDQTLKEKLKATVLDSFEVQRMDGKGRFILRQLFKAYFTNPRQLPDRSIKSMEYSRSNVIESRYNDDGKVIMARTICDEISGMTDTFALKEYHKLYVD